jgi:protein SCO1
MTAARLALWLSAVGLAAQAAVDPGVATAPRMEFVPPAPGSYTLERIQPVRDAILLSAAGTATHLAGLTSRKITLLTFFYTYCADPLGCPFAYTTLTGLRDRLLAEPGLAARVRFVSVSFDPTTDTPQAIGWYGQQVAGDPRFEWQFLTARSVGELMPVLDDFGQDVSVEVDARGHATRTRHHMLKLFLIDAGGEVREIYTLAYLQPQVMLNDIKTLAMESAQLAQRGSR